MLIVENSHHMRVLNVFFPGIFSEENKFRPEGFLSTHMCLTWRWCISAGSTGHRRSPLVVYLWTLENIFDQDQKIRKLTWTQATRWWRRQHVPRWDIWEGPWSSGGEGSQDSQGLPGVISCLRLHPDTLLSLPAPCTDTTLLPSFPFFSSSVCKYQVPPNSSQC